MTKLVGVAALVAASILMVSASPAVAAIGDPGNPNPIRTCRTTPVYAHRGDTQRFTENTRAAVDSAFRLRAAVEVDVRTAADDTLVLLHDRTVNRTTNGHGKVVNKTWRQLRRYRTPDGLQIPRLVRVLRMVRDRPHSRVMLDLKHLTVGSARVMTHLIARYSIQDRVSVISFWYPLLDKVKALDLAVHTSIIATGDSAPAPTSIEAGHHAQVFPSLMTDAWVDAMNGAGIEFTSRIDDRLAAWNHGISVGTHAIVSDTPRAYLRACHRGLLPGATDDAQPRA
jgi:glycerophosphoryl diester phosphodiesterase